MDIIGFGGYGMFGSMGIPFIIFLVWSIFWKGLALWHSSQRKETWWFIAMLVINTAGILEIVYLFAFAKKKPAELFAFTGLTKREKPPSGPGSATDAPAA